MELFVVMIADRHTDPTAYVFSTQAAALTLARRTANGWLTENSEPPAGWIYLAEHPTEADTIWVERKFLDEPGREA